MGRLVEAGLAVWPSPNAPLAWNINPPSVQEDIETELFGRAGDGSNRMTFVPCPNVVRARLKTTNAAVRIWTAVADECDSGFIIVQALE